MKRVLGIVVLCGMLAGFFGTIGIWEHREMLSKRPIQIQEHREMLS